MSKYDKVPTDLKFVEREKEVEKFWKDNDIFQKSIEDHEGHPTYMFYDGPPTANGKPHIGHVLTSTERRKNAPSARPLPTAACG